MDRCISQKKNKKTKNKLYKNFQNKKIDIMTLLLLILFGYALPAFLGYHYIRISHSKGGINEDIHTSSFDIKYVFVPALNLVWYIGWGWEWPKEKKPKTPKNYDKFFNIKK